MVKKVGKYEIGKTLGEGTFGKVKYAVNSETDERVAIKVLDKEKIQKQNMGAQIKREISIMKMVRNPHVVVLKEVLASRTKIFIVLELVTGGELFDKIVSEGRFDEKTARFYFRQLVAGVEYCHSQGVCHRDLKPENLLLDENEDLKISDFGLSALYDQSNLDETDQSRAALLHTTCGTPNYVAPEVLADKGYDGRAADVWSIGVILYVLLAGFLPFDEPTMSALFRKIQKAEFSYPSWFSEEVRTILNRILVANPEERATLADLLEDPWMVKGNDQPRTHAETKEAKPVAIDTDQAQIDAAIEEGVEETGEEPATKGPKTMNAFELINLCGGMTLNRLLKTSEENKNKKQTHFVSPHPAAHIMDRLEAVLTAKGCEINASKPSNKIKAISITQKGAVGVIIQVYVMADSLNFVEVRRGKGDILEYQKFFAELKEGIADIM
jgi:serine/threonine protein kinase